MPKKRLHFKSVLVASLQWWPALKKTFASDEHPMQKMKPNKIMHFSPIGKQVC